LSAGLPARMVVLSLITRNSYSKMQKAPVSLEDVLDSTLQIPYKQIILVDDSVDETRNLFRRWCDEHGKELIVSSSKLYGHHRPTRATARQTAIDIFLENFSDDWLMFVDDDVVLNPGWWEWVRGNMVLEDADVGEVWGINWDASPERERFLKLFGIDLRSYLIRKFEERGGTHDTLYNRRAIAGIRIPPELHVYEDAFIHFYVKCGGWKSVINPVGVIHYHPMNTYTDLRREKELLRMAIVAAVKYGICEYENAKLLRGNPSGKLISYLALLRPVLGLAPMLLTTIKVYGVKDGVIEALKRQYLKLWFRWQVLRAVKSGIPDVCEGVRRAVWGQEHGAR